MSAYDQDINLAFFGDSYADDSVMNENLRHESCYARVVDMFKAEHNTEDFISQNYAQAGASAYWSYFSLKRLVEQSKCRVDYALVTFTDTHRLPFNTPRYRDKGWLNCYANMIQMLREKSTDTDFVPDLEIMDIHKHRQFWEDIFISSGLHTQPYMQAFAGYRPSDVFAMWNLFFENNYESYDTARFINAHTLRKTVALAKEHNIKLVVVIPFRSSVEEYLSEYPEIVDTHLVIVGLDEVSRKETRTSNYDGLGDPEWDSTQEVKWKTHDFDNRCNHLCRTNNKILSEIIYNGLKNNTTGLIDFAKNPDLNYDEIYDYADLILKPKG
jgi:hypothetical protein